VGAFADKPLHDLLDCVAAQQPAPGGGCSAAWAGAFAAGLVEMAASFTLARPKYAGVHHRMADVRREAKILRRRLLELAEADAEAYEPVILALRMPDQHPDRQARLEETRSKAADVPLETAEATATLAGLAVEAARVGNVHLTGDAVTAAVLAEAACRSAAQLVEINLAGRDDPRVDRVGDAVRRASASRDDALVAREEVMR
jgi:formiminotetrahydrofolate cyclodeaminase